MKVNSLLTKWLAEIPSFKFVDLLYQLCARMITKPVQGVHAENFPHILISVIERLFKKFNKPLLSSNI